MSVINYDMLKLITPEQIEAIADQAMTVPEIDGRRMSLVLRSVDAIQGIRHLHALAQVVRAIVARQDQMVEVA
jgi:hypothetical protein